MQVNQEAPPFLNRAGVRAARCRALLRADDMVEKHLGKTLAARLNWRSLMELYLAELEDRSMFSSCFATGESSSNVHRRSIKLAALGALTRQQDPLDHRRVDLKLTSATRRQIEHALDDIIALDPQFRQEIAQSRG